MLSFTCDYCKKAMPVHIDRVNGRVFLLETMEEAKSHMFAKVNDTWIQKEVDPCPFCKAKAQNAYKQELESQRR